jgi:hypothetical protein
LPVLVTLSLVAGLAAPAAAMPRAPEGVGKERAVTGPSFGPPPGYQWIPAAATNGEITLVVWEDGYPDPEIKATRVSPDGHALDVPPILIAGGIGAQGRPSVAWTGQSFLVVWEDDEPTIHLRAARVREDGKVIDPEGFSVVDGPGFEFRPAVAFDGTNAMVAWSDSRDGDSDMFVARVRPDGLVLDQDGIRVSHDGKSEQDAAIAWNGECYLLVWDRIPAGNDSNIQAARVGPDGAVLDSPPLTITAESGFQAEPSVASDGSDFLVTWNGNLPLEGGRVTGDGDVLDPGGFVIFPDHTGSYEPMVDWDGAHYVVAWFGYTSPEYVMRVARVTPAAEVLDDPPIELDRGRYGGSLVALAWDGVRHLVVWAPELPDGSDLLAARMTADGVVLDDPFPLAPAGLEQTDAAVAVGATNALVVWQTYLGGTLRIGAARMTLQGHRLDPSGIQLPVVEGSDITPAVAWNGTEYLVTWEHEALFEDGDLHGVRVAPDGTVLDSSPIVISHANKAQETPAVASDGTDFMVVWEDERGTSDDIYGTRVAADGSVLDPLGVPIFDTSVDERLPDLAWNGQEYLASWEHHRTGADHDVYAGRLDASGTPLDPTGIVVSAASGHQKGPTIATDGAGFLVAWEDQRGTSGDLYGARIGADGTTLDPDGIALVTGSKQQGQPALAWLGENYLMAFTDFALDPKGDVRGELIAADGQVLGVQGIAESAQPELRPAVGSAQTGQAMVTYQRFVPAVFGSMRAFATVVA